MDKPGVLVGSGVVVTTGKQIEGFVVVVDGVLDDVVDGFVVSVAVFILQILVVEAAGLGFML